MNGCLVLVQELVFLVLVQFHSPILCSKQDSGKAEEGKIIDNCIAGAGDTIQYQFSNLLSRSI